MRPSGTEPKVKCYYEVVESVADRMFDAAMTRAETALSGLIAAHQGSLERLLGDSSQLQA